MIDYCNNQNFNRIEPEIKSYMARNECSYAAALKAVCAEYQAAEYSKTAQSEQRDIEIKQLQNFAKGTNKSVGYLYEKLLEYRKQYGQHFTVTELLTISGL